MLPRHSEQSGVSSSRKNRKRLPEAGASERLWKMSRVDMWEWRTEERTRARPRRRRGGGAFEDQFIRGKQDKRAQKTSFRLDLHEP